MTGKISLPDLKHIRITDSLFRHYADMVAKKMIPVQWNILNGKGTSHCFCIDNFRVAAGELQAEHRGVVFGDTDAYKWLEAVAFCANNGQTEYLPMADDLIALIGRAQQPDGYLNTYFTICEPEQRWQNLAEGHELYSAGHLIEAAVAYYEATGKRPLLEIACKFADLICHVFGPEEGQEHRYPGHQEIELALVKLWHVTGQVRYLETARYFIDTRGTEPNQLLREMRDPRHRLIFPELRDYDPAYSQSHVPPVQQKTAEGHAVRAMYQCSAMADLAMIQQDENLRNACHTLWQNVTRKRMYITGGIGSSGLLERFTVDYDLPNDRMYCESCASIGLMMFGQRMSRMTGEAFYYDTVERALYNTVLAGVSAAGDRYFYVNPLEVWPENCKEHTSIDFVKPVRQPWFEVACCPANIARTLASLGQYIYAMDDDSLYINLLIGSDMETVVGRTTLQVKLENSLMQSGDFKLHVTSTGEERTYLRIRIPEWMEHPVFSRAETEFQPIMENGYVVVPVDWQGNQIITVHASVPVHTCSANLQVRADVGKVAFQKGPFVYCFEQQDNGENLAALQAEVGEVREIPADEALPGGLPELSIPGRRIVRTGKDPEALYSDSEITTEPCSLTAVPYALWGNRTPGEMRVWLDAIVP